MFSLLHWFAVCHHVEDILEQRDALNVSEKTRESIGIKIFWVKDIYIFRHLFESLLFVDSFIYLAPDQKGNIYTEGQSRGGR